MANRPNKTIDPTEAALAAIQEGLNGHDEEEQTAEPAERMRPSRIAPEDRTSFAPAPNATERFASAGSDISDRRAPDLRAQVTRAANDDQQSVGQILQALQRRPARTSYVVAAACSGAWLIGCFALSFAYLSSLSAALGPNHSSAAVMIGLGALALLPIIFFFGVAHMAWRAQELRLIAQAMAGVAMRLAEPEAVAQDAIVSVGQAIRREVAAMGDGVERALARASELEAMVQNEVAALARAYGDNETRIRGLMRDLGTQRETLVSQAEQVRSAINNVHIDLTQDLSTISELVEHQVDDATQRITTSLAEKAEHITLSLSHIGDTMIDQLSVRGGDLLERLETVRAETTRAVASASDRLNASLGFKTDHIGAEFAEIAQGLDDMLTARLDRVTEHFSEKSLAMIDTMVTRAQDLTGQALARSQELTDLVNGRAQEFTESIIETSSQIAGQIAASTEQVSHTLRASGESLVLDLNLRGVEIATRLEETGARITDSLVSRSSKMTDSVREGAEHLISIIASRNDAVKELLATRLAAYEEMLSHSGLELGEKISRNASTLGNLITRHLTEFDRTVKSYGAELVERLGVRTQEISDAMRGQIENFDSKVGSRANEATGLFDERLTRLQDALDSRTQTLTEALSARVLDIAKTLAEGGKEAADAIDKRGGDVAALIDSRGQQVTASVSERLASLERTLGVEATAVANTLDQRIERLETLLLGRTQAVIAEMDTHSRAAADLLNARLVELSDSIKTNSTTAGQTLSQLVADTTEALGKTAAASSAATEALNRSAAGATAILQQSANAISSTLDKSTTEAAAVLNRSTDALSGMIGKTAAEAAALLDRSAGALSTTIGENAAAASDAIEKSTAASSASLDNSTASVTEVISRTAAMASETIGQTTATATDLLAKTARESSEAISRSAGGVEQMLSGINSQIVRNVAERAERIEVTLSQCMGELTRVLDDKSAEMTRALDEQSTQMTRTLVEKSAGFLNAFSGRGEQFAGEITRVTDEAVKAIEAKGFVFTRTMMDNSEEIARRVNETAQNATAAVARTLGQLQEGTQGVAEAAKTTITQTLQELHGATGAAIEQSKKTAAATVADMLETHGMLRSDSTALFERLREANILLQEVLSGAHENMNAIERTMASRVSEFVAAMNELNSKSGTATANLEEHLGAFNTTTVKVLGDLSTLATQFTSHGRALAEAVELLESSNRRTQDAVASRHASVEALVATLDARADDFEQRLRRFSGLLDESLDSATARAREIAGIVTETSNESVQAIEQQFDVVRASTDEQRRQTSETLSAVYEATLGEAQAMFNQSAERFAEIVQAMKQMAAQMQRELEATRAELRRGVLELPQETAENAAQMRRVIVEQMEALAELNRIVARHGNALDAVEPTRREAEPAYAAGGARPQPLPARPETGTPVRPTRDITGAPPRRPDSPSLNPIQGGKDAGNGRGGGWLSELLTHASRDDGPSIASSPSREGARSQERLSREAAGSLEALSVDIARMIDHEATAELWDRYQRGESRLDGRHLYTAQGQKAFEEIRRKYRGDAEFRETVEHYIDEFERLLEDVSRGESGHAVARNYLASDTGKVYTMLAHAAGRFEQ
jgi:hypothetical protein